MLKTGFFSGSFDPFTIAHESIVDRALNIFDNIIIGVGHNSAKKNYMFDPTERVEMIQYLYNDDPRVKVIQYDCLTVDIIDNDITAIIRGVRNSNDFEFEKNIMLINNAISLRKIETILFMDYSNVPISSSMVRELMVHGKSAHAYLPTKIHLWIFDKKRNK